MNLDCLTNEFIRFDVGINGAKITDKECSLIRLEVQRLHEQGFHHVGVYWTANRLAADGVIHPRLAKDFQY